MGKFFINFICKNSKTLRNYSKSLKYILRNPNDVDNYPTDISNLYHRDHHKYLDASLISSMHRYGDMDLKKLRKQRNLMESSKYARHYKRKKRKADGMRLNELREPLPKLPFWDAYDSVNQLYLELGKFIY